MFEKSVGEFTVRVSDPYPYWVTIEHEFSDTPFRLHHDDLEDLMYALRRASHHIDDQRLANRPAQANGD